MEIGTFLDTARGLGERLKPGDLDATLSQITSAAVDLLPNVQYSSLTVHHADGSLSTAAPTDELLLRLDVEQYRLQEGPCYYAAADGSQVVSSDLGADKRFPEYGHAAVAEDIHSQIVVPLFVTARSNGALNLYSRDVGAFDDLESLSALFAHQAGQAIAYALEIDNLSKAVKSRTLIGQAVGIMMERYDLSDERAFALLRRISSYTNVKLRLVAEQIIAPQA